MDATDHFAEQANRFESWILESSTQGGQFAREAVQHLMRLYLAALELPAPWSDGLANVPDARRIDDEEIRRVANSLTGRLPFDMYGVVSDPLIVPPEECSIGSLADDLLDIYRDVVTGLWEYEGGAGRMPFGNGDSIFDTTGAIMRPPPFDRCTTGWRAKNSTG